MGGYQDFKCRCDIVDVTAESTKPAFFPSEVALSVER